MVQMSVQELADYEKKDPVWWCQHHKNTVAHVALRLEQVLDGREDLEQICRVLIKNIKEKNGIVWNYYDAEKPTRLKESEN